MAVDDLLLRDQRQDLHRNARRALEPLSRTPERLEQLGYHAEMAGEFDGALTFILELCRLAVRSSSLKTVRALYARAKGLRPRATPQSLPVFFAVTAASFDALQQSGDRAEYRAALDFVIGHAGQVGDRVSEGLAHAHLALICWMMAKHDDGYEHAETALTIARELRSLELRALAQPCLAHIEHARGNIARAIALHAEIVEALEGELERSTLGRMIIPSVRSRAFLAWLLADVGRFAEAQAQVERADAVLKQGEQPFSRILLDAASGYLAMRSRRPRDAIAPLERAREACLALQSYVMEPAASGWLASALVRAGDPLRALEIAQQSIDTKRYEKAGRYSWVYIHQALAEAQFACGAKHPAIETVGQALSIAEQSREPVQIAYARFARAQMLFALGKRDAAMEDAQQALSLAAKHGLDPLAADCRELFSCME
jgi:tetratricopeptide (TPR) repeat protein